MKLLTKEEILAGNPRMIEFYVNLYKRRKARRKMEQQSSVNNSSGKDKDSPTRFSSRNTKLNILNQSLDQIQSI